MDAATLVMIVVLADGTRREASKGFDNMTLCELFTQRAIRDLPKDMTLVSAECVETPKPFRMADPPG